ncbi:hypothetical protein T439DRAFT_173438 [Meredithblackwellia eburnea MCA 4105]
MPVPVLILLGNSVAAGLVLLSCEDYLVKRKKIDVARLLIPDLTFWSGESLPHRLKPCGRSSRWEGGLACRALSRNESEQGGCRTLVIS